MLISFGQRVRELRKKAGLSGKGLAEAIDTTPADVCNIERSPMWDRNKRYGTLEKLRAIADVVGVDWLDLLPHWIVARGSVAFEVVSDARAQASGGVESMKVFMLSYLLRNWGRLTRADMKVINTKLKEVQSRWPDG